MSVNYIVMPIDEEFTKELTSKAGINWLYPVSLPSSLIRGRYPTFWELKQVLETLNTCTKEYHVSTSPEFAKVEIFSNLTHTELTVKTTTGSLNEPCRISFRGGDAILIYEIVQNLANICGAFLVTMDGEDPTFIAPQGDILRLSTE